MEKGAVKEAWNPDGVLSGATSMTFAGTVAYITTPRGLVVVDLEKITLDKPVEPELLGQLGAAISHCFHRRRPG